jgi:uncharacterized protein YecT (DUF1311 family)
LKPQAIHRLSRYFVLFLCALCSYRCAGVAPSLETMVPTSTWPNPIVGTRTPTFPSGDPHDFQYSESDCAGTTYDMMICIGGKAYASARALDELLRELDSQFPNGTWEIALERILMSQEEWESLKQPYCTFANQESIGGTAHSNDIMNCIYEENLARTDTLTYLACSRFDGFARCAPKKPGGEPPFLTAIPSAIPTR